MRRRRRLVGRQQNIFGKFARELEAFELAPETRRTVFALLWFLVGTTSILSLFGTAGRVGAWLQPRLFLAMGVGAYVIPFAVVVVALSRLDPGRFPFSRGRYVGLLSAIAGGLGLLHLPASSAKSLALADAGKGGGYIGWAISFSLSSAIGEVMATVTLVVLVAGGFILLSNRTPGQFFAWVRARRAIRAQEKLARAEEEAAAPDAAPSASGAVTADTDDPAEDEELPSANEPPPAIPVFAMRTLDGVMSRTGRGQGAGGRIKTKLPSYERPPLELLSSASTRPVSTDIKTTQAAIQQTLKNFGMEVEMGEESVGPTVTQYTLKPAEGVKLSKISALHNDLALALAAHPIRIEAPIPGRGLVGIEVPNKAVSIVRLREILSAGPFAEARSPMTFALGKDVSGAPIVGDLAAMPHLLVAGATGSGKSVTINSLLISLLYRNGPATLRLILVDPKRVELPLYDGIPHLLSPVIIDPVKTVTALHWAVAEMDRRYDLLSSSRKRDLESYNVGRRADDMLPRIVIIIDELADIMARHARDVENAVIRLAQIARAVGIHLVLATQRPSVDVITGLIKANITSRIAFKVASSVDSRTILDGAGAEKLLGNGDMLYLVNGETKPRRLQGAYVSEEEVKAVVRHLTQIGEPEYETAVTELREETAGFGGDGEDSDVGDELYEEAKRVAVESGRASTSLFQRRLRIGYGRAARIIDMLEERGVIGPPDGSRPRAVLIGREEQPSVVRPEDIPGSLSVGDGAALKVRPLAPGPRPIPNREVDKESAEEDSA